MFLAIGFATVQLLRGMPDLGLLDIDISLSGHVGTNIAAGVYRRPTSFVLGILHLRLGKPFGLRPTHARSSMKPGKALNIEKHVLRTSSKQPA